MGVNAPARPFGSRSTTLTPSASCPSRNTVALTASCSPGIDFAGYRPHSSTGCTSTIGIRSYVMPDDGVVRCAELVAEVFAAGAFAAEVFAAEVFAAGGFDAARARGVAADRPDGILLVVIDPKLSGGGGIPR